MNHSPAHRGSDEKSSFHTVCLSFATAPEYRGSSVAGQLEGLEILSPKYLLSRFGSRGWPYISVSACSRADALEAARCEPVTQATDQHGDVRALSPTIRVQLVEHEGGQALACGAILGVPEGS